MKKTKCSFPNVNIWNQAANGTIMVAGDQTGAHAGDSEGQIDVDQMIHGEQDKAEQNDAREAMDIEGMNGADAVVTEKQNDVEHNMNEEGGLVMRKM